MHNSLWVGGSIGRRGFPMLGTGKRGLSTYIKELFKNGEQGFFYDPNDLTAEKINWRKNQLINTDDFTYGTGGNYTAVKEADGWALTAITQTSSGYSLLGNQYPIGAASDSNRIGTIVRSIELKKGTGVFRFGAASNNAAIFVNAATMTAIDPPTGLAYTITAVGSDWYRIETFFYGVGHSSSVLSNSIGWSTAKATTSTLDTTNQVGTVIRVRNPSFAFFPYETTKSIPYQAISDFNSDFIRAFPLHTLYQDAAGTIPVTAVGQPLGLVLDKSKGLRTGANLAPQKSFAEGTAGWTLQSGWTLTGDKITCNGSTSLVLSNTKFGLGKRYRITIAATRTSTSGTLSIRNGSTTASEIAAIQATGIEVIERNVHVSDNNTPHIYFLSQAWVGEITSISIEEIVGNHAYQTTSASRPILRQNAITKAYYLEFDGSDDFLQTSNIDFTATDKVSLFAGVRKLSDATTGMLVELSLSSDASINIGSFYVTVPLVVTGTAVRVHTRAVDGINAVSAPLTMFPDTTPLVISANMPLTGNQNLNVNRTVFSNVSNKIGNYGNYPLYIGRRGGTTYPFNGHLYSLIGIGRLTTDAETVALEKLIAKNTGVTLS